MQSVDLTNILIVALIGIIGFIGKKMISKIDRFEKIVQDILLNDVADRKDIEYMKDSLDDHEVRITNLEK
jgi:hypothetical protein